MYLIHRKGVWTNRNATVPGETQLSCQTCYKLAINLVLHSAIIRQYDPTGFDKIRP